MPEVPHALRTRLAGLGLSRQDVLELSDDRDTAAYFDAAVAAGADAKAAANWIMGDIAAHLKAERVSIRNLVLRPQQLAELVTLVADGTISSKARKGVLSLRAQPGSRSGARLRAARPSARALAAEHRLPRTCCQSCWRLGARRGRWWRARA